MAARLTRKQIKFVEAFMGEAEGDATAAARLAGYNATGSVLRNIGCENLQKPNIAAAIAERVAEDDGGLIMTRKDRQVLWSRIARGEVLDGDRPAKMGDRLKASEILGKSQGDFIDRVEHSGPNGGPIATLPERTPEERNARIKELTAMLGVLDDVDAT